MKEKADIHTIVGDDYDEIVLAIHDYYKDVFARASTPATKDKPKDYDFASNENPQYWCNKLKNHTAFHEECSKRGIADDEILIKTKREIANILITFDKQSK